MAGAISILFMMNRRVNKSGARRKQIDPKWTKLAE